VAQGFGGVPFWAASNARLPAGSCCILSGPMESTGWESGGHQVAAQPRPPLRQLLPLPSGEPPAEVSDMSHEAAPVGALRA